MKPISNRARDYLVLLRRGPMTEAQLRRGAAELTESGRSHEKFHAGRRPNTTKVLPGLEDLGFVEATAGVYSLTVHGAYLAEEILHADHFRLKAERERKRAVQLEEQLRRIR